MKFSTKKKIAAAACLLGFAIAIGGSAYSLTNASIDLHRANALLEEYGYEEFNSQYKAQTASLYATQFQQGDISADEMVKKVNGIEDYSKNEFMKQTATPEDYETYYDGEELYMAKGLIGSLASVGVCLAGSIPAAHYLDKKKAEENNGQKAESEQSAEI